MDMMIRHDMIFVAQIDRACRHDTWLMIMITKLTLHLKIINQVFGWM
jgi:hypothetical protein